MRLTGDNFDHHLPITRAIEFKEQQPLGVTQYEVVILDQHRLTIAD